MPIDFYPFELHTHTYHSDAKFSPEVLAKTVAENGLKGFALTDHNTDRGCLEARQYASSNNLVFIDGEEWTTFYGHITHLGNNSKIDWREINPKTIAKISQTAIDNGDLVGIAHPFRVGYPICTGGSDEWGLEDYSMFTHYEIWSYINPSTEHTNMLSEARYLELCKKGNRLACVYGRDWHGGNGKGIYAVTYIGIDGKPTKDSAIRGIRKRHTYVSTGVKADITLNKAENIYYIGDEITNGTYRLECVVENDNLKFYSGYNIVAEKLCIIQKNTERVSEYDIIDNKIEANITLSEGYAMAYIVGKVDGNHQKIAVFTPFFIKETNK